MKRLISVLVLFMSMSGILIPTITLAQATPDTSEAEEADQETVAAVDAFIDDFDAARVDRQWLQ